jgi:hypothetical protein
VSTAGYENIELSYRFKADNLENDAINKDEVRVQYSLNGGATWVTIYSIADGEDDHIDGTDFGLYHKFHSLPTSTANNSNFMIRFDPDLVGGPDEVWIDDVMVTGIEMGENSPAPAPAPTPLPPTSVVEQSYEECNDSIDNDRDGAIDVFDLDCLDFRQTANIVTQVVGGTFSAPNFFMDVMLGTTMLTNDIPGSTAGSEVTRPEAGIWKIVPRQQQGYTTTFSGDCDPTGAFAMSFNMHKTCSVTHTLTGTTTPPPSPAGNETSYLACSDTIDNDGDGSTDVFDLDCLLFRQTMKIVTVVTGGALHAEDFLTRVRFNADTQTELLPGSTSGKEVTSPITSTWQVLPILKPGYTPIMSGDCSATGAVAMGFNMYKTCTVTWTTD